ncbi:unnamed protein product [Ranitomeya imitator]|uniref:Breast carcinoma-amplified sequence 4 n=1 Tax=Ranitomeya imitator TaxID=111125 RepID=A0ABN9LH07_9NEOB|nr:unnamed protein product [Ranitomeya imitator]
MEASGRVGELGAQDLETSVEEMLIRLDEFCAMMDMIRSETSLIIDDRIPEIERRAEEMSKIYRQVEKLEAFVKMVGHHVSYLEEELIRAERDHLSFPHTVKKLLTGDYLPMFLQVSCLHRYFGRVFLNKCTMTLQNGYG